MLRIRLGGWVVPSLAQHPSWDIQHVTDKARQHLTDRNYAVGLRSPRKGKSRAVLVIGLLWRSQACTNEGRHP